MQMFDSDWMVSFIWKWNLSSFREDLFLFLFENSMIMQSRNLVLINFKIKYSDLILIGLARQLKGIRTAKYDSL